MIIIILIMIIIIVVVIIIIINIILFGQKSYNTDKNYMWFFLLFQRPYLPSLKERNQKL